MLEILLTYLCNLLVHIINNIKEVLYTFIDNIVNK